MAIPLIHTPEHYYPCALLPFSTDFNQSQLWTVCTLSMRDDDVLANGLLTGTVIRHP